MEAMSCALNRIIMQVLSSIIAAWADIGDTLVVGDPAAVEAEAISGFAAVTGAVSRMNAGYFWMFLNCGTSAAYVRPDKALKLDGMDTESSAQVLTMRKRIKLTGFSDWDTMFYNNLLSIPVLAVASIIAEDWGYDNLNRNL